MSRTKPTRTRARRRRPRWTLLVKGVLCIVAGFGLGAVAGAVAEAPRLLVGHLAGDTESVALAPRLAPAGSRPLEPPPLGARTADGLPPSAASAPPAQVLPPAVSAPAPGGAFVIQVGAFSDSASAESLRERLGSQGYPVYVESSQGARGPRWRVRVGPVPEEASARRMAQRLKSEQRLPTWIQNLPR